MRRENAPCWSCLNAVPDPASGTGCSWSADSEPVEGWAAEPVNIYSVPRADGADNLAPIPSYRIRSCPAYRPG